MNLKITAAVAVALACSTSAFASNLTTTINNGVAAGTIKLVASGSSASRDAFLALMKDFACNTTTSGDTFDVYEITPTTNKDFRAYSCTIAAGFGTASGKTATVYYRSEGGSAFGAVPIATNTQVMRLQIDNTCTTTSTKTFTGTTGNIVVHDCVIPAASGDYSLATDTATGTAANYLTKDTVTLAAGDEEPKMYGAPNFPSSTVFPAATDSARQSLLSGLTGVQVGFAQIFSVIVNTAAGSPFVGASPAAPPQIGRTTLSGIFSGAYNDWQQVPTISGAPVSPVSVPIKVCRREQGSGTQVAAAQYFLGVKQCVGAPGTFVTDAESPTLPFASDTDGVIERGTTGDLTACVQALPGGIGFIAVPANGVAPANTAFVAINGQTPSQQKAASGQYDFVYELTYKSVATGDAGALASGLISRAQHSASAPPVASVISLPNAFNDPFSQTDFTSQPIISFGSRGGNSCSNIKASPAF